MVKSKFVKKQSSKISIYRNIFTVYVQLCLRQFYYVHVYTNKTILWDEILYNSISQFTGNPYRIFLYRNYVNYYESSFKYYVP